MAKKKFGKRALATLLSLIMLLGMVNVSVLAADAPQMVKNYEDTYYKQDGTAGTAEDWEIHLSKQAAVTRTENVYDVTLTVATKDTSVQLGGATHGAVTLVLDVSSSMVRSSGSTCAACGQRESHENHTGERYVLCPDNSGNTYQRGGMGSNRCANCNGRERDHLNSEATCTYTAQKSDLDLLKDAVKDFLDEYVSDAQPNDKRLVAIVKFHTDASTVQTWIDVNKADNMDAVKAVVDALTSSSGTNIEAGLVLGRNLLNVTDALAGIPVDNQALILFSDGEPSVGVGDADSTSTTQAGSDGGGINSTSSRVSDDISDILAGIRAKKKAVAYDTAPTLLNRTFGAENVITSSADTLHLDLVGEAGSIVTTVTTPTVITDPMGEGVSLLGIHGAYADQTWNLADYTPTVADGVTTYTITYQVELDPTAIAADPDHEGYTVLTPANGVTTLDYTVGEDDTPVEVEFSVPDIRGILPRFDLTVNYVDEAGNAVAEQITKTGILYGTEYTTEQKAVEDYTFERMAEGSDAASGMMDAHKVVTYVYSKNPVPKYTVSYEYVNAPEGAPALPEAAEYEAGAAVTVADEPELEGYTFSGWDKDDFEMPAENVVITGSWTAIPKYTVSYEYSNAPEGAPALPEAAEYEAGAAVTVAADAYLEGYIFSGWDKENFTMPAEDVVITGSWTVIPPNKYNVVYQYEGELPANPPALPETAQYEAGEAVTVADAPELEGYTFSGWDKGDFTMPAEDVIVKGRWTKLPDPKYPVSYAYINEIPEGAPALPETVEYVAGAAVTVATAPYLEGYTFSGWDKTDFEMPAEAVVITGSWEKNPEPKYPVSYEYRNAPTGAPALPATVSYVAGTAVTVADEPYLDGYTFSGWDTDDFTMPAEAVIITGSWTKKAPPPPPVVETWEGKFVLTFDKAVAGDTYTMAANEFTFELTDAARFNDGSGHIYLGENFDGTAHTYTARNDGSGRVEFTVPFIKDLEDWEVEPGAIIPGAFVYTLTEAVGTTEGMTYDPTVYTILVQLRFTQAGLGWEYSVSRVSVLHDGESEVTAAFADGSSIIHLSLGEDALYTNTYDDGTGALTITKVFAGRTVTTKDLTFRVVGPNAFERAIPYADFTDGSYTLNGLEPGSYTVTEENAAVSGYRLTTTGEGEVEVTANENAEITITNTYNKRAPYRPPVTPTPDPVTPDPGTPTPDPVTPDPVTPTPDPVTPDPVTPTPDPVTPDPVTPTPNPGTPGPGTPDPAEPDEPIDIPDEEVPLVDTPELPEPPVDIPDEDVPLADVPRTDDKLALYVALALLSGTALVWLAVEDRKRRTV